MPVQLIAAGGGNMEELLWTAKLGFVMQDTVSSGIKICEGLENHDSYCRVDLCYR